MVVEDERITALSLCRTLSRLGYDVTAAHVSGEAALEHIAERPPDLVLMDIHLEGLLDGIETTARIPPNLMLPVVYLSAFADDATLQRARATKPYGYVVKPATEQDLNAAIQMALERRATDLALRESELRLRLALETAELGMWELDSETEHILYKDHAGWSSDARPRLLAERFREFLSTVETEDRGKVMAAFDRVSNSNEPCEIEFRRTSPENGQRWYRVVGKAVHLPNDRRRRIVGVSRDVTSAKLAAAERWESEQNYRELISNINGIIWEVDRERNVLTYVSDSVQRVLGYSAAEWLADALFWEKHIHPDDLAQAMVRYHMAPESGRSVRIDLSDECQERPARLDL